MAVLPAGKHVFEGPPTTVGRDLVDSGVAIGLSSGYHSISAASFSMQMSIALAVTRLGLTVEEAISAATVNAAYAIGCGPHHRNIRNRQTGGPDHPERPDYRDIPEQFGINHVAMVFKSGTIALNRTRWRAPSDTAIYWSNAFQISLKDDRLEIVDAIASAIGSIHGSVVLHRTSDRTTTAASSLMRDWAIPFSKVRCGPRESLSRLDRLEPTSGCSSEVGRARCTSLRSALRTLRSNTASS